MKKLSIEEKIFDNVRFDKDLLLKYGFREISGDFYYSQDLQKENLRIDLVILNDNLIGKIFDKELNEEYYNYRLDGASGFSREIREKFVTLLKEIRRNCCKNDPLKYKQIDRIADYLKKNYQVKPEYLWEKYPSFAVFRNKDNNKWFALIGRINWDKFDTSNDGEIEFINIKVNKDEIPVLLKKTGFYPAYHMNKRNWISVILNSTLNDSEIKILIDNSFQLVSLKK